jgi:hypothetical protein
MIVNGKGLYISQQKVECGEETVQMMKNADSGHGNKM